MKRKKEKTEIWERGWGLLGREKKEGRYKRGKEEKRKGLVVKQQIVETTGEEESSSLQVKRRWVYTVFAPARWSCPFSFPFKMWADIIHSQGQAGLRGTCCPACPDLEATTWSPQGLGALPETSSAPQSCFPLKGQPKPLGAVLAVGVHCCLSLISWRLGSARPHFNIISCPSGFPSAPLGSCDLEIKDF